MTQKLQFQKNEQQQQKLANRELSLLAQLASTCQLFLPVKHIWSSVNVFEATLILQNKREDLRCRRRSMFSTPTFQE